MKKYNSIWIFSFLIFFLTNSAQSQNNSKWPADQPWWKANNLRMIQTNLPAYEATLNVDSLVADLQYFSANVLLINAGGIMAFYPTKLDFQYTNPHMTKNMLKEVIEKLKFFIEFGIRSWEFGIDNLNVCDYPIGIDV